MNVQGDEHLAVSSAGVSVDASLGCGVAGAYDVVHRLPKRYGRTVLHCVLELCAQLSLPMPDSLMLRLKSYAELTEYEVAVECFMSRAAAGQPLATCRAALALMPRNRYVPGRDDYTTIRRLPLNSSSSLWLLQCSAEYDDEK